MPKQPIAIPYKLREALQRGLTHYKIIFVSAGTGWGKTTTVNKLLEKQNAARLSLRKKFLPSYFSKERLIVMDDRSEERRGVKESNVTCRSRWSPYH